MLFAFEGEDEGAMAMAMSIGGQVDMLHHHTK